MREIYQSEETIASKFCTFAPLRHVGRFSSPRKAEGRAGP
jgi:hypothetical protein